MFGITIKMVKSTSVTLSFVNKASIFYEFCQLTNAHKFPFLSAQDMVNSPFLLVYFDLWTSPQLYMNNEKYFLSIVNDFSIFIWFFSLAIRDQTFSTFLYFKSMVELQFVVDIKLVQTNRSYEFKPMVSALEKEGILHRCTYPQISKQNCMVESPHKSIVES